MIGIIDLSIGNTASVQKALRRVGVEFSLITSESDLARCDGVLFPGVGNFNTAISRLLDLQLFAPLKRLISDNEIPFLGICLGMQILADHSEEGDTETHGLGIFRGCVTRLPRDSDLFRVPHVGWNTVESTGRGLFFGTNPNSDFYFTHGYYLKTFDEDLEIFYTDYGIKIPAYIRKGNVHGVQFHPEKSDIDGLEILNNFAKLC